MSETETPEVEGGFDPIGALLAMSGGRDNPKPDTAQGVADLVAKVTDMVEERSRVIFGGLGNDDFTCPVAVYPDGRYELIAPEVIDRHGPRPTFRRGVATLTSLDSFIAHVNRFGDEDSAVFASDDRASPSVLAVLDYHRKDVLAGEGEDASRVHGEYRHGKHRAVFKFPVSDEWKAWTAKNGEVMTMTDFAHFLEDNVLDVAEVGDDVPESAERFVEMCGGKKNIADWSMLTALAKSLSVFESATVTQVTDLHGGAVNLTINEAHDTEVGGVTATVPTMFFIAIPIFRDGAYYRLPVRLRYRKGRGGISFWFEMWRHDRAFMDAVKDAVTKIGSSTEAQVFYGSPEA